MSTPITSFLSWNNLRVKSASSETTWKTRFAVFSVPMRRMKRTTRAAKWSVCHERQRYAR